MTSKKYLFIAVLVIAASSLLGPLSADSVNQSQTKITGNEASQQKLRFEIVKTLNSKSSTLAFSPDGKVLAQGGPEGSVRLWDVNTAKTIRTIKTGGYIPSLSFSPNGKILAIAFNGDHHVRSEKFQLAPANSGVSFYDLSNGKLLLTIGKFKGADYQTVSFNRDGNLLAVGGCSKVMSEADGWACHQSLLRLYDTQTGKMIRDFEAIDDISITSVVFSPVGSFLASSGAGGSPECSQDNILMVKIWEINQKEPLIKIGWPVKNMIGFASDYCNHKGVVQYGLDGKTLALGSFFLYSNVDPDDENFKPTPGSILLLDASKGEKIGELQSHSWGTSAIAFSPDGHLIATGGCDAINESACSRGTVKIWNLPEQKEILTFDVGPIGVNTVRFSPDGKLIATADENAINIWESYTVIH